MNEYIKDYTLFATIKYNKNFYKNLEEVLKEVSNEDILAIFVKRENSLLELIDVFQPYTSSDLIIKSIDLTLMHKLHYFEDIYTELPIQHIEIHTKKIEKQRMDWNKIPFVTLGLNIEESLEIKTHKLTDNLINLTKGSENILEYYLKEDNKIIRYYGDKSEEIFYLTKDLKVDRREQHITLNTITRQKKEKLKSIKWGVISYKNGEIKLGLKDNIIVIENKEDLLKRIFQENIRRLYVNTSEESERLKKYLKEYNEEISNKESIHWKIKKWHKTCDIVRSDILLPIKVEELSETFGYEEEEEHLKNYRRGLEEYRNWIYKLTKLDLFNSYTLSHLSYKIWKSMISLKEIPIITEDTHLGKICREAYYGGWSEIYRPRSKKVYMYDINSQYPSLMRTKKYPIGKEVIWSTDKNLENYEGFVKAEVQVKRKYKNILPRRSISGMGGGNGTWIDWFTSEELKYAKKYEEGIKIKVIEGYKFKRKERIFKTFVDKFYGIKQDLNTTKNKRKLAKLILNTLVGYLGARRKYFAVELSEKEIVWAEKEHKKNKKRQLNIGLAAWTTALARIAISKYRLREETIGIMIDTIFTEQELDKKEISDTKLGYWRLEKTLWEPIILNWNKYAYKTKENEEKINWPIMNKAEKKLTYKDFEEALTKGNKSYIEVEEKRVDIQGDREVKKQLVYRLNTNLSNRYKVYNEEQKWEDTETKFWEGEGVVAEWFKAVVCKTIV